MIFYRNLLNNKARSLMTLLGAAVGIAVLVSVSVITGNLRKETRAVLAGYDTGITIQAKGAPSPLASRLKPDDLVSLKRMFGESLSPLVIGALRERWNPYALVFGTDINLSRRFSVVGGRCFSPGKHEVMLGILAARRIGTGVGATICLGGETCRIVGIFSTGSRLIDGAVVTELAEAQRLLGRKGSVNLAMLAVRNPKETNGMVREVNGAFPRLKAQSSSDFVGNLRLFKAVDVFAVAIVVISFIGACLTVTNTLLMAVSERTREIGILMAIGWRPFLILRMLAAESFALCLSGAVVGNILAILVLSVLNRSSSIGLGWVPVSITPGDVVFSLGLSVLLAFFSLIWPASVVFRLSPVEALRHE